MRFSTVVDRWGVVRKVLSDRVEVGDFLRGVPWISREGFLRLRKSARVLMEPEASSAPREVRGVGGGAVQRGGTRQTETPSLRHTHSAAGRRSQGGVVCAASAGPYSSQSGE